MEGSQQSLQHNRGFAGDLKRSIEQAHVKSKTAVKPVPLRAMGVSIIMAIYGCIDHMGVLKMMHMLCMGVLKMMATYGYVTAQGELLFPVVVYNFRRTPTILVDQIPCFTVDTYRHSCPETCRHRGLECPHCTV